MILGWALDEILRNLESYSLLLILLIHLIFFQNYNNVYILKITHVILYNNVLIHCYNLSFGIPKHLYIKNNYCYIAYITRDIFLLKTRTHPIFKLYS